MAPVRQLSRLVQLSENIIRNAKLLNAHLVEKRLPQPSFAAGAPPEGVVIAEDDPRRLELDLARRELVSATKELHDLALGPAEGLKELSFSINDPLSLRCMYRYSVAKAFPINQTITYSELAKRTKLPLQDLKRLIRHAITNRIFAEPRKDVVAHTAASRLLAENADIEAFVGMATEEFWPAAPKVCEALEKWQGDQEPSHTGLSIALGRKTHLFEAITSSPHRAARFATAMKFFSSGRAYSLSHLVQSYPWSQFTCPSNPHPLIVDLGGSFGHGSAALAAAHPSLRFQVQDLPSVYAGRDPGANIPAAVRDRISFVAQDFFEEQRTNNADVYLIRWCLHNWSDKYAIRVLRALRPALKRGARVVVNDGVLPEPRGPTGSWWGPGVRREAARVVVDESTKETEATKVGGVSPVEDTDVASVVEGESVAKEVQENDEIQMLGPLDVDADYTADRNFRSLDLLMLQALNARERDLDEWRELFRAADERFVWKGATRSGRMWIMEAEWSG